MLEAGGAEQVAGIAKDREIVVYCGQVSCDLSLRVAEKLQALGFTRVTALYGGLPGLGRSRLPRGHRVDSRAKRAKGEKGGQIRTCGLTHNASTP